MVEDEPDLLRVLGRSLREAGYAVDEAADGKEGLYKAGGSGYDAVVLDLMLPRMDGVEVLRELRRKKKTPVLILTARDTLRALIRRAAGDAVPTIDIGEVSIDTVAKAVSLGGQEVGLTAREYALVEFLALHRGELVTRTMIYEHLFDESDDSLSNLVDVHVANVRKKLGHDFITTRRGQGYVIQV
ncbi:MAG: response regulator transcription factor [Tepidisphaeraceae bacterium]